MARGPLHTSPPPSLRFLLFNNDKLLFAGNYTALGQQLHKNRSKECRTLFLGLPLKLSTSHICLRPLWKWLIMSLSFDFHFNGMRLDKCCHTAFRDSQSFESDDSNKEAWRGWALPYRVSYFKLVVSVMWSTVILILMFCLILEGNVLKIKKKTHTQEALRSSSNRYKICQVLFCLTTVWLYDQV